MPKQKTRNAAAKRFKVTASGRLMRRRTMKNNSPGSSKRTRQFRKETNVASSDVRKVKEQLNLR